VTLLSAARDLRRRKARERRGLFVAEGIRTVEELVRSNLPIDGILAGPQIEDTTRGIALIDSLASRGVTIERVGAPEFASAAETDSSQGILALAPVPAATLSEIPLADSLRLLILDAVQDPGNAGTMIRTAAALGAIATIALPGTVDLWNAKVVRSAMGAHFYFPPVHSTRVEFDDFRQAIGLSLWGADAAGEPIGDGLPPARLGIVLGNEGAGLSSSVRPSMDRLVSIPMAARSESLNVAVAAGIILHEVRA
jgi:TrmH family RNA methyltransferase